MEDIINSLEQSLINQNWYASLFTALALPDICGKIDEPLLRVGARYAKWFNEYVQDNYKRTKIHIPNLSHIKDPMQRAKFHRQLMSIACPKNAESEAIRERQGQAFIEGDMNTFRACSDEFSF